MRSVRCRVAPLLTAAATVLAACRPTAPASVPLFERLTPESTGVTFVNQLPERPEFSILNYLYYYDGGGVAVGDVDRDGYQDLYFSSNLGSNKLYRNKGNYVFEDITDRAGVKGPPGWKTGVTMADVNGDEYVDIYISAVSYLTMNGRNVLYVNNGDGTFADRTKEFGLEHVGYSTQAAFFDFDMDGDLDMYLLNHSTHNERSIGSPALRNVRHARAGDRLFRNDGKRFTDVSVHAGIYGGVEGFGLGVVASDLNVDGCPDLYVANDFQENDFLYVNNCDGTFTESIARAMGHTSRSSMGVDAADFNNDALPDVMVLDMLPEREEILKTSASSESFNLFSLRVKAGYHPQYARNTLQLNRGSGRFSEIGYLAGVFATDWSWAPLFADLDNDGRKDLFITNGIYRRPNDLDYINYVSTEAVQASLAGITEQNMPLLQQMPQIALPNYAYKNNGDLTFTDMAKEWGLGEPSFANGAAYVDLNNSGSLDLVVNHINAPSAIYRNRGRDSHSGAYLTIELRGDGRNTAGVGTKVLIKCGAELQLLEQMPTRGFQSSVDPRLHFGLGTATSIDSLTVVWPDGRSQTLTNVRVDTTLVLSQRDASGRFVYDSARPVQPLFEDVTTQVDIDVRHTEDAFLDFNREPLMPHVLSTEGPALAVGDVNGDSLDDVYLGGAKWQPGRLLVQQADGKFAQASAPALGADSLSEDIDAAFFDADGDGDADLYVVSGGNEFWGNAEALNDRLYLNDGKGEFQRATAALPPLYKNGSCVVPGDFDGDGRMDLFIGSRVVAREYGRIPQSYLLRNEGGGRFRDVTADVAPGLSNAGMVSSAAWADLDGDTKLDLVVVGEWMPVRVFRQINGRFVDQTAAAGLAGSEGWWNSVAAADINGDARPDLVLGNLGRNSYIRATPAEPAQMFVYDFGHTGALKQVLTFYKHGVSHPLGGRDDFVRLIPSLRRRYPNYSDFGASRYEDIFPAEERAKASTLQARTFASSMALNNGSGRFTLQPLPVEAQFAPIYTILARDFDDDARVDLLLAGNFHGVTPMLGMYDASYGTLLRGRGAGMFSAMGLSESGLAIEGEVRDIKPLRHARWGEVFAVARNNERLIFLRRRR